MSNQEGTRTMPLFEVTLRSTYQNQEIINRWNYISEGTPAAVTRSFALWGAFVNQVPLVPGGAPGEFDVDGVMQGIALLLHQTVTFNDVTVLNVYDPLDFYASGFSFTAQGVSGGEAASPLLAYGFTSGLVRRDIRRGQKRFSGVSETNVTSGGIIAAGAAGAMQRVADDMTKSLTYNDEGNTLVFTPCVVGKQEYIPDPLRPTRKAYRYWKVDGNTPAQNEALQLEHVAVGINWSYKNTVRSQNSRQYGKGR